MSCQRCQKICSGLSCCSAEFSPVSGSVGADMSSQRRDEVGPGLKAVQVSAVRHVCGGVLIKGRIESVARRVVHGINHGRDSWVHGSGWLCCLGVVDY